jgi:hypothetical protein
MYAKHGDKTKKSVYGSIEDLVPNAKKTTLKQEFQIMSTLTENKTYPLS